MLDDVGPWIKYQIDFDLLEANEGFRYLGFALKPKDYCFKDWAGLIKKIEKKRFNIGVIFGY